MKLFDAMKKTPDTNIYFGNIQKDDDMLVVPVCSSETLSDKIDSPDNLVFNRTINYGTMEFLKKEKNNLISIIPDKLMARCKGGQDHCVSMTGVFNTHKKIQKYCCCIESSQGGKIFGDKSEYDIMPIGLRTQFSSRFSKTDNFSRLWPYIIEWMPAPIRNYRAHLCYFYNDPEIKKALNEFTLSFEPVEKQIGFFVFFGNKIVGIEIFPTYDYFYHFYKLLIRGCYGAEYLRLKLMKKRFNKNKFSFDILNKTPEEINNILLHRLMIKENLTQLVLNYFEKDKSGKFMPQTEVLNTNTAIGMFRSEYGNLAYLSSVLEY